MNGSTASNHKRKSSNLDGYTAINFVSPFKEDGPLWKRIIKEASILLSKKQGKWLLLLCLVNLVGIRFVMYGAQETSSLVLQAYIPLLWFNLLSLSTCILCLWVDERVADAYFTFGFLRCEVLAVFSSITLAILISVFTLKECLERFVIPEEVLVHNMMLYAMVALVLSLTTNSFSRNAHLDYLIENSSSSFLQEQCSDVFGRLSKYNPLNLVSIASFVIIFCDYLIIDIYSYQKADNFFALIIIIQIISTLMPLCLSAANILLQTVPVELSANLDKCLREALTIDGVLEFPNEKFWVLGLKRSATPAGVTSRCVLVGSLHVRVRRDANEQFVLRLIQQKLTALVDLLTVQVFKDDWKPPLQEIPLVMPILSPEISRTKLISPPPSRQSPNGQIPFPYHDRQLIP